MARTSKQLPELGLGKGAQTSRGMIRANLMLKVAATLFAERGYDSVSINDIGFAAGVTGPAVYRYFPSKEALLVAIYQHLYRRNSEGLARALAEGRSPAETLERLIDLQIQLATEEPEKIRIVASEERHLPEAEAEELDREVRKALRIWTDVVRQVRQDLSKDELDATVHAVLALINSISLRRKPTEVSARVRAHLRAMAQAAVFVSVPSRA
jgi:AcrR family transcriptional regulator